MEIVTKFEFGDEVEDKVTGFRGTLTGYARYLTGCDQCLVNPKTTDTSKYPDGTWLDENRLVLIKSGVDLDINNDIPGAGEIPPMY